MEDQKIMLLNLIFTKFSNLDIKKGRRIPINVQDKVNIELMKLLDEKKHIIKLSSCPEKYFHSPIVVTVKKDQSVKLALNSKIIKAAIHKIKYQMPNIDTYFELIHNLFPYISLEVRVQSIKLRFQYSKSP